jgi:hypothetical protein
MARKNFPTAPVKTPSPRVARPPSAARPPGAHASLIHGFLVRLVTRSTNAGGSSKPTLVAMANVKARAQRPSDTRHEGPADDATFH